MYLCKCICSQHCVTSHCAILVVTGIVVVHSIHHVDSFKVSVDVK